MLRGSGPSSDDNDEDTAMCILKWSDSRDDEEAEPSALMPELQPPLDHELAHMIKLQGDAHPNSARAARVRPGSQVNVLSMLAGRQANVTGAGRFSRAECCHVASRYLPTDVPEVVEQIASRAYTGQFSQDGSLFIAGFQDRRIRIYDVDNGWSLKKNVVARNLRWTVTDTSLSPDQRFLVYASILPIVHLVNIGSESGGITSLANVTDIHEGLNFSADTESEGTFGLWSLQFSGDGRELVAGSSDKSIYVYDLEACKPLRIVAHKDDVNTVVFADESSNILYSGSDDKECKVWDRRCLGSSNPAAGKLIGHLEGISFIDSRRDGRYFISNGKDQTTKLWDIRKLSSKVSGQRVSKVKAPSYRWDYRWMDYPRGRGVKHPMDQSIMTYRGHQVLRTLIRCYFSPAFTTGQKYIYTGSHDGCVYIYDLVTGEVVAKLRHHEATVRDCSWHPTEPTLVSASWDGQIVRWQNHHGEVRLEGAPCHPLESKWRNTTHEEFSDTD